jgi:uncharacterized protein (DUF1501 family)
MRCPPHTRRTARNNRGTCCGTRLRGDKALTTEGPNAALALDTFFALNPAMLNVHRLYHAGQAAFVHAAATSYRERSLFDGQDVLESGRERPGTAEAGWLNRALAALEPAGRAARQQRGSGAAALPNLLPFRS